MRSSGRALQTTRRMTLRGSRASQYARPPAELATIAEAPARVPVEALLEQDAGLQAKTFRRSLLHGT